MKYTNTLNKFSTILALVLTATTAYADLDRGLSAYQNREFTTAIEEFKISAESGDSKSQVLLGNMYYEGIGVPKNPTKAFKWLSAGVDTSSEADDYMAAAKLNLGIMYIEGKGTQPNHTEAFKLIKSSASAGQKRAQRLLAMMYMQGVGVNQNPNQAIVWYKRSKR